MTKYICEKCGKEYTNKYHYTKHIHKEISCVVSETQPMETENKNISSSSPSLSISQLILIATSKRYFAVLGSACCL